MRLELVEIRDFRSIFVDDAGQPFRLDLASGANTLVGLNNCGKSNVLRAISLAMDPHHPFRQSEDQPGPRPFSLPVITLGFRGDPAVADDAAVLEAAEDYELASGCLPGRTRASRGEVALQVSFVPGSEGTRREEAVLTEVPARASDPSQQHHREVTLTRLRDAVRFVLISSGESIESVLEGNFREILHSVVRERLRQEFDTAEQARQDYISGLQDSLLRPLRERLAADVGGMFPEIDGIHLSPDVSSIERTLSNVGVSLDDLVSTPLAGKGTGVRGGVLVAMLSYLALNTTRSLVFAVEEPEAFLHPSAQEDLRDHLEQLAGATGVSLLVTTHSPFTVTRAPTGRVFCLAKDNQGRTRLAESAAGDADHAPLVGGLLREATLEALLKSVAALPLGTQALVVVEGEGDCFCLELTARLLGRPDLLADLCIRPTGGAVKMIAEAVIAKAAVDVPIVVVVDNDESGLHARSTLVGTTFGFEKKKVLTYAQVFGDRWGSFPVEAEDLFAPELISRFVDAHGPSIIDGMKKRPDAAYHYDFAQSAKEALTQWLTEEARAEHLHKWVEMLLLIRTRAGLPVPAESAADLVGAAPTPESTSPRATDGLALIVSGQHDHIRYTESAALVLDPSEQLPPGITHVGFYARGIQPQIAAIVTDHPNLLLTPETAAQLRVTGREADARVAAVVEDAVRTERPEAGTSRRVLLLSGPDDDATIVLPQPVKNTKQINGKPVAWTLNRALVPLPALLTAPATTDELDAAIAKIGAP